MEKHPENGFTLIELFVALAVMGILAGVGIPSFISAVSNSRVSTQYNSLIGGLYLARSEAVKTSNSVTVCARASDTQCGSDWTHGWLVFVDKDFANNEATASVGATDIILEVRSELNGENTLKAEGSTDNTAATAAIRNFVRYSRSGQTDWRNGSFTLCDNRGVEESRAINIVLTGDIRRGRTLSGSEIPMDVFGREITCS